MSKQEDDTRLPEPFETMLRDWPAPQRDQAVWDESADSILTRIAMARRAPGMDKLFEAPLPLEQGEGADPSPARPTIPVQRPSEPIPTDEVDGAWGEDDDGLNEATVRVESKKAKDLIEKTRPRDIDEDTLNEATLTKKIEPAKLRALADKSASEHTEPRRIQTPPTMPAMAKPEPPRIKTPEPIAAVKPAEPPRIKTPGPMAAVSVDKKDAPPPSSKRAPEPIDEVLAHATVGVATPAEMPVPEPAFAKRPSPVPAVPPVPASAPRSLLELAKASMANEDVAKESADIARASLSLASKTRATPAAPPEIAPKAPPMAQQVSPPAPPPPAPNLVAPAANVIPMSTRPPAKRSLALPIAGGLVTLVAFAAAAVIFIRVQRANEAPVAVSQPPAPPAATAAAPAAEADKVPAKDPEAVALNDLPSTAESPSAPRPSSKAGGAEKPGVPPPTASAEPKPEEKKVAAPTPEKEKDEEGAKMKPAAIPTDLPDHPSTGAVQAAIGAVLSSARACVAGQDLFSTAIVTFANDGSVQGVKVTGGAAGKPPEACIQAALMKARVQPFSRPTFSVSATIRPP